MRRILASDFGIWPIEPDVGSPSDAMVASRDYWSRLANYVLLYDQIIVPTGNLQVLPVLRLMLGEGVFDELVRNRVIVLARFDQWFGYAGDGAGIVFFQIEPSPDRANAPNLGYAFFKPIDEAIDIALSTTTPFADPKRKSELTELLSENVVEIPLNKISDEVRDETYKDILGSPYLRDLMALRNAGRSMNALRGIGANQLTYCHPNYRLGSLDHPRPGESPEISAVLRVAFENFILGLGGYLKATEITGDDSTLSLLKAKGQRFGLPLEGNAAFTKIQEVSGVPDIGAAFAAKQLQAAQLLALRQSKHAQALRDWFADGQPSDSAQDTLRRYVEALDKPSWLDALPTKLIRIGTTTVLGVVEPAAGVLASAADTFLLSKWFPRKSPRLFLREAQRMLADQSAVPKPLMRGRSRNSPCPCGSGKKFKKCCGR
ncbi:MAG: SEC-C domain-containing protein [Rhodospirillaceae bacterium]|nr:SEC-C domain-containing protein [Rhodospirillaceae bacterium]